MIRSVLMYACLICLANISNAQVNSILPVKLKTTITLKAPVGVAGQANGMRSGIIIVNVDTTIRSNPKNPMPDGRMAYLSIDFTGLTGATQMEIASGKESFWVFDKAGKEVVLSNKVLHRIKATMEASSIVDMTVKVPYRLKTDKNIYTIHYRWESPDKSKNIDILTSK